MWSHLPRWTLVWYRRTGWITWTRCTCPEDGRVLCHSIRCPESRTMATARHPPTTPPQPIRTSTGVPTRRTGTTSTTRGSTHMPPEPSRSGWTVCAPPPVLTLSTRRRIITAPHLQGGAGYLGAAPVAEGYAAEAPPMTGRTTGHRHSWCRLQEAPRRTAWAGQSGLGTGRPVAHRKTVASVDTRPGWRRRAPRTMTTRTRPS